MPGFDLCCCIFLSCPNVGAYIYDDFSSAGINTSKWATNNSGSLFSQPGDGKLYFYSDNTAGVNPAPGGSLLSTAFFTPGFFSLDFNDFFSSNTSPGGRGLGSFAALGLGTKNNTYVRMLRGRVISEDWGYFEANYYDGTDLHVWYVYADATSGQLGLSYDGSMVRFFYNGGNGWQNLDTSGPDTKGRIVTVTPGWSSPPPIVHQRDSRWEWSDQFRSGQSRIHARSRASHPTPSRFWFDWSCRIWKEEIL